MSSNEYPVAGTHPPLIYYVRQWPLKLPYRTAIGHNIIYI